jgi:hypothetical protein
MSNLLADVASAAGGGGEAVATAASALGVVARVLVLYFTARLL